MNHFLPKDWQELINQTIPIIMLVMYNTEVLYVAAYPLHKRERERERERERDRERESESERER